MEGLEPEPSRKQPQTLKGGTIDETDWTFNVGAPPD